MRESKSGSSAVCAAPDAPVVNKCKSAVSSEGSMPPSRARGVAAGNGGGSPVAGLGEKFKVGSGSVWYGAF